MIRRILLCAAAVMLSVQAKAVGLSEQTLQVGVGTLSCATWLNEPRQRISSEQWVLGFWSAMNTFSQPGGLVGNSTDQAGIIGEVKKDCQAKPSLRLMFATYNAYIRMQKLGE